MGLPGAFWCPVWPVGVDLYLWIMEIVLWKLRFGLFREILCPAGAAAEAQLRGFRAQSASWMCRMEQGDNGDPQTSPGAKAEPSSPILLYLGCLGRATQHQGSIPQCPLAFTCTPSPRQGILSEIKSLQSPALGNAGLMLVWDLVTGISSLARANPVSCPRTGAGQGSPSCSQLLWGLSITTRGLGSFPGAQDT